MSSWKSLLLPIGDKGPKYSASSNVINCIETCFLMLRREFDQAEDEMLAFLIQCAEQLPHKIPFYGTLECDSLGFNI